MCVGTTIWITGCSRAPGRPAPTIYEVFGAGLPYRRFEPIAVIMNFFCYKKINTRITNAPACVHS